MFRRKSNHSDTQLAVSPAKQVSSAEHAGLIWAMVIGWIWFAELPEIRFYLGSSMIVVPILLQGLEEKRRGKGMK